MFLARPVGWCSSLVGARLVRIEQFVFTVVALGLCASTSNFYEAPSEAAYATAVSVLSLVYLLAIFFGSFFAGPYFMVGPLLVSETVMLILWFAAFIAMAVSFGGNNCNYIFSSFRHHCREAKVAIAFCAVCMALYAVSLALLLLNCVVPLCKSHGSRYLWRAALAADATFDRGTGLVIYSASTWVPDAETGVAAKRQPTASSLETSVGPEKPLEHSDQPLFHEHVAAEPIITTTAEPIVTTTAEPAINLPVNAHTR